jgi:hypothetical protein
VRADLTNNSVLRAHVINRGKKLSQTQAESGGALEAQEWLPENSIVDPELALMAQKGVITEFNIIEDVRGGFYITLRVTWRPELLHLATRRERDEPRMFMNLDRLVKHIREKYSGIEATRLVLLPEDKKRPVAKKAAKKVAKKAVPAKKPSAKTTEKRQKKT